MRPSLSPERELQATVSRSLESLRRFGCRKYFWVPRGMRGAKPQGLVEPRETLQEYRSQTILLNPSDQQQVDQQVQSCFPISTEPMQVSGSKSSHGETRYQLRIEAATKSHRRLRLKRDHLLSKGASTRMFSGDYFVAKRDPTHCSAGHVHDI